MNYKEMNGGFYNPLIVINGGELIFNSLKSFWTKLMLSWLRSNCVDKCLNTSKKNSCIIINIAKTLSQ